MYDLKLTAESVRLIQLAAQGLLTKPRRKATKTDVLHTIRQMGALQIDTIHVVARSPYLVLWSRLGAYQSSWLDEHLAEGALFEYWAHEACFLPREDYGLFRHRMVDPLSMGWKYSHQWMEQHQAAIAELLQHIRNNGPVRSVDFERKDGKGGGWWSWKPEKRSLEVLFTAGVLMVARRQQFQRVYDLRERVLPDWDDVRDLKPDDQCKAQLWEQAVQALGVARASWIGDYYRTGRLVPQPALHRLCDEGRLVCARVDGWKDEVYLHPSHLALVQQAMAGELTATHSTLLSPFDPLVWDRKRASQLFGFDYKIECYTPAPKRQFGYFVLPILRRGQLVGRLDAKAHRQQGIFEVKALYLEPGIRTSKTLARDVAQSIQACADWHGTPRVVVARCEHTDFLKQLRATLSEKEGHTQ
ncbi:winged helix-turn-helix domain-containing protein [Chitinivorax sp. B]|uniref:winged helix-turn-helix domain-containing protein n=1 Tax=Chitinivorax sp. B TaxID=2502235 RepID=UPI0010F442C0|nr:winged helix-turn-helix domain-containing protein [Chitinivorax sp. B]